MSFDFKGEGFGKKGGGFGKNAGGFGKQGGGFSTGGMADDPLAETQYTGYLDEDLNSQLSELQKGFKKRAKKEKDRFERATDPEFWFAVYFQSREEKEAFLAAMKLHANVYGDRYIDGKKWARALGLDI